MTAGLTRGRFDELTSLVAIGVLEVAVDDKLDATIADIAAELNFPYRLGASWPTRDAILHFSAPRALAADGAARVPAIQDDTAQMGSAETTLNMQTGAITGGTIKRNGVAFTMPTMAQNQYCRAVFVQVSDGSIDSNWSSACATYGALPNPGTLFASLDGNPIGFIDLQQTTAGTAGTYKTADSLTGIVEPAVSANPRIWRFGSGSGVGGGGDSSFKLQPSTALPGTTVQIKKGRIELSDGRQLITGNVTTDAPANLTVDLATVLGSPSANTNYWLYVDLWALGAPATMTDTGREVYKVYSASHFAVLTDKPTAVNSNRYMDLGPIRTGGSAAWAGAVVNTSPTRKHNVAKSTDANQIFESVRGTLQDSTYEYVTPIIFNVDQSAMLDVSANGGFAPDTEAYKLTTGLKLVSAQMLDDLFLAESTDVATAMIQVVYAPNAIDTNPAVKISRAGVADLSFQDVTVSRLGGTDTWIGELTFAATEPDVTLQQQTGSADTALALDATTTKSAGQKFVPSTAEVVTKVALDLTINGTPEGYLWVSLVKNSGGLPSVDPADILCEGSAILASGLASGVNTFSVPATAIPAGTYHAVIRTDDAYKTHYTSTAGAHNVSIKRDATATGQSAFNASWTAAGTKALKFSVIGRALDLRAKITASTTSEVTGLAVFYGQMPSTQDAGVDPLYNRFDFKAVANNTNQFTLSWLPDPRLLMCVEVRKGKLWVYPAFNLDGKKVTFPASQFNNGGIEDDVTLVFTQPTAANDNNPVLTALLTANFLGSTDSSLDRSSAGRGVKVRNASGLLREIALDASDNVVVLDT